MNGIPRQRQAWDMEGDDTVGYDFTTVVNRHEQASEKWALMRRRLPDIGGDIVPFSVADMELKNPPEIIQGLIDYLARDAVLGYTVPYDSYLNAVRGWMARRHDWRVEKEWICVSSGVIPALYDLVKAFAGEGDGVILMTPVYYPFYSAVEKNGRRVLECPLTDTGGAYEIDFGLLEKLARDPRAKLLLFCSPHNPVGRIWKRDELARAGEICVQNGVTIVSDEIHFDLIQPGYEHTVMANISRELSGRVVTCTAPSKTFNLAGMQAANIIIENPALRDAFRAEQARSGFDCMAALGFRTCELAYTKCEGWLEELIGLIERNKRALADFLAEHLPEAKLYPLEGTYLAWIDFRALGMTPEELENFMIEKAQVFFDEGYIFGKAGEGFERMNLACPTETLLEGLRRISAALGERKG